MKQNEHFFYSKNEVMSAEDSWEIETASLAFYLGNLNELVGLLQRGGEELRDDKQQVNKQLDLLFDMTLIGILKILFSISNTNNAKF